VKQSPGYNREIATPFGLAMTQTLFMKLLTAAYILPINQPPFEKGTVVIEDQKIIDVGPQDKMRAKYPEAEVEDFPQAVLMPGLVNAHTHLDLLFFDPNKSKKETGLDFFSWLVSGWQHRKNQTLADRRNCLEEGIRQLTRSGTTTVGDAGQFFGMIPHAVNSPMRMVLFPEILTGGDTSIQEAYESAFSQVEEIRSARSDRITAGIAPYAAYTLSRHLLKILSQQASSLQIPVKIHVAETFAEMQFFYESSGEIAEKLFPTMGWGETLPPAYRKTPVQYLESIGFLETSPTLVGGNHLADPDLQILAKTKSKVVHAPRCNSHLNLGNPPLKKLRKLKIPVALGTDAIASMYSLSLWDEMRYISDHCGEGEKLNAEDILHMATLDGARALNLEKEIGSLEAGKEADLVAVRLPQNTSLKKLEQNLIAHTTPREIISVIIAGKKVKL